MDSAMNLIRINSAARLYAVFFNVASIFSLHRIHKFCFWLPFLLAIIIILIVLWFDSPMCRPLSGFTQAHDAA